MKLEQFNKLVAGHSRPKSKTLTALRFHLVDGLSIHKAADKAEIRPAGVFEALRNLKMLPRDRNKARRGYCPHCGKLLFSIKSPAQSAKASAS